MPVLFSHTIQHALVVVVAFAPTLGYCQSPVESTVESRFDSVREFLVDSVEQGKVAGGAVMLVQGDQVVFESAFGFADVKSRTPFELETPGIVASISKPMMGTVAFCIAEKGDLELDRPIDAYLPAFKNSKLIDGASLARAPTMLEFFRHRAGTRRDDDKAGRPWFADWTKGQSLAVVVDRYAQEFPFRSQPGTSYGYSGIGIDIASRVMEVVTRRPRNELLIQELCAPLGMQDTFYVDNVRTKNYDMPTRYYIGSKSGKLYVSKHRAYPDPNTYSSSGGSIISTVADLSKWLIMLRDKGRFGEEQFLQVATIEAMLDSQGTSQNTNCGFFVRQRDSEGVITRVGHTGSSGTNCWIDFETDTVGVMLTQTRGKDIKPFRIELEKRLQACVEKVAQTGSN